MNRVKKLLTSFIIFAGVLGVASALGFNDGILTNPFEARAVEQTTTITVNSSVTNSSGFTATTYVHPGNSEFVLNFDHVKAGGGVGTIKGGSYIRRNSITRGLSSIKVDYAPSGGTTYELKVQSWFEDNDKIKYTYDLNSGEEQTLRGNFFCLISGASNDTLINSIELTFSCQSGTESPRLGPDVFTDKNPLKNYAKLTDVFTWDDTTNDKSWYVIQCELNDVSNNNWDKFIPYLNVPARICSDTNSWSSSISIYVSEIRLLSSGRFQFFFDIFSNSNVSGDFWAHLSFCNIGWNGDNGDGSNVIPTGKYNNGTVAWSSRTDHDGSGGCSKGTYTCWSQWNMCNLTINWK